MTLTEYAYQCDICNRGFESRQALGGHKKAHSNGTAQPKAELGRAELTPNTMVRNAPTPIGAVTEPHPASILWLVRRVPYALALPLLGTFMGGATMGMLPPAYSLTFMAFGTLFGLLAAYKLARNVIAPRWALETVERTNPSGATHRAVVLRKRWLDKKLARREMAPARRSHEGESYWLDLQDPNAPLAFNPLIRSVPHYHLTPQQIRFAIASEPTRVLTNSKLFSIPAEALHVGASIAVSGVCFFIIAWAIGMLQDS